MPSTLADDALRFGLDASALRRLAQAAIEAKAGAYCPYSQYRVGAALLLPSEVITGANVENASYPVGTCAERCAMAKAVADGKRKFLALAVATDSALPGSPCGMCRQFIREFCAPEVPIFLLGTQPENNPAAETSAQLVYRVMTVAEMLPESFGPESLQRDSGR